MRKLVAFSAGGDGGRKPVRGRIANAKSVGWAIYAVGFAIWLFGYLSAGHAPLFDWKAATPWWISSFVPNLEAELGLALMFASMIPIYGRAVVRDNLARVFAFAALLVFGTVTFAWWGFLAWLIWRVI
jgi:hypothetical protein